MVGLAEAIEDPRNVFVGELREHVGFTLKGGDRLLLQVGTANAVDHFRQRARTSREPQILGQIDQLHAPAAERSDHPVASADYGAGRDHLDRDDTSCDRGPGATENLRGPVPGIERASTSSLSAPDSAALLAQIRCMIQPKNGVAAYMYITNRNQSRPRHGWRL